MKTILYLHYWGALVRLGFKTYAAGWIIIGMLAIAQSFGIAMFFADMFSVKTMEIQQKIGAAAQTVYVICLVFSGVIAFASEIICVYLSNNGYRYWAMFTAFVFGLLSFSSYYKFFDTGLFSIKLIGVIIVAFLPVYGNVLISELMNRKDVLEFIEMMKVFLKLRAAFYNALSELKTQVKNDEDVVKTVKRELKVA